MLFEDAYALPPAVRTAMFYAIDRMALGMAAYARRPTPLRLVDLEDVTRYCCFVAGLVGEMLTELWAFDSSAPAPRFALAYHFGVFLQKVNILKDQEEDETAGRFLVPDYTSLLCEPARRRARCARVPPGAAADRARLSHVLCVVTDDGRSSPSRSSTSLARAGARRPQELLARTAEIA